MKRFKIVLINLANNRNHIIFYKQFYHKKKFEVNKMKMNKFKSK